MGRVLGIIVATLLLLPYSRSHIKPWLLETSIIIGEWDFPCTINESGTYILVANASGAGWGTCIIIEADNIVFDGGGHRVSGWDYGILVKSSRNVTIRNVVIENSYYGIHVSDSSGVRVEDVFVRNNCHHSIFFDNVSNSIVRECVIENNLGDGVELHLSNHNKIEYNTITGNAGSGVLLESSDSNLIRNNVLKDNSHGIVLEVSSNNTIEYNSRV